MEISVIIPLYRCNEHIELLTGRLVNSLCLFSKDFEIIYINDGSPDNDWRSVLSLAEVDKRIKGVNLSRNFGQHYAITAGLQNSSGNWIVVMDGDLQDQPEEIIKLFKKAQQGYDIVLAMRTNRQDSWLKRFFSKIFYSVFSYLTDTEQDASVANFGIYHRDVVNAILNMKDSIRYFPTMVHWVGFNRTKITVEHARRSVGKSSYNFGALMKLAFNNMIAFSDKPLRLTVSFGFLLTALSLLFGFITFIKYLNGSIMVPGYASIILSIWFLGGLIIAIVGIVGIYVGKVFEKVKDRPTYIISSKINFE
ncbi:glycosyltransferase family 2 protein [Spirosoma aerolatum]|uniref:glycosyltransferase family 2 protein n=1 Tax=Spirosoma aerolatum TaxID=1211326 RepID=UPI0009AE5116|nr:glycosyltransferase family 2 protein [Spirosoma aerolatum]